MSTEIEKNLADLALEVGSLINCDNCDRHIGKVGDGTINAWTSKFRGGLYCCQACCVQDLAFKRGGHP